MDNEVFAVVGHDPEPMVALIHRGLRGESFIGTDMVKRTAQGQWADIDMFGKTGYVRQAWPWYDDSILVLGERRWVGKDGDEDWWSSTHEYAVRFGVARGRPKGPHVSAFKTAGSNCPIDVWAAHATTRGDVVAVVGCRTHRTAANHGTWVMRWFRDDLDGSTTKRSDVDFTSGRVVVGPQGETVVAIADSEHYQAFVLDGETWKALDDAPAGKLVDLGIDAGKRAWVATDTTIARTREAGGWDTVGPTEAKGIIGLAGVEHGTPWVLASNGAWGQDAHERWTAAVMPTPTWFPSEDTLHARRLVIPRKGEVWIRADYESPWPANMGDSYIMQKVDYAALLTNAKVAAPVRCGTAVDPAYPEIDLRPWPVGHREGCASKVLMLMRLRKFDGLDGYGGLRKVMRKHEALKDVKLVEIEGGGNRLLGAMVTSDEQAKLLGDGVRGYRSGSIKPEASCGDEASLAAAGFRVVREMRLQADGRAFREGP